MAFSISKFFAASVIIASAMLFDLANACTCPLEHRPLCDQIIDGDLVVSAVVVGKSQQESSFDDITYTALINVIKPEIPGTVYPQEITFTTPGSPSLCGVDLQPQERYLLDLSRDENFQLRMNSCRLLRLYYAVEEELQECLAGNCNFSCGVSQECAFDDMANVMYCANTCEAVFCKKGEKCTIGPQICRGPISSCPPCAICVPKNK